MKHATTLKKVGILILIMNANKSVVERYDKNIARQYMAKAVREGRTGDDGLWDYLETLGIRRPEATDAIVKKVLDEDRKSTERILGYLEEIRKLAREAQRKYAHL